MVEKISKWWIFHLKKCRSHDIGNILVIIIENKQTLTSLILQTCFKFTKQLVLNYIKKFGFIKSVWMTNEISEKKLHRMIRYASNLICHENEIFFIILCEKDIE